MRDSSLEKKCISCRTSKNVRHQGPRCVNCYRKEVNPQTLERIKAYRKKVGATLSDRYGKGKTEAKARKIKWNISKEEFAVLNSKPCFYCGGSLPKYGVGLDRILQDKSVGYSIENVVPCCTSCNSIRGDKLSVAEMITVAHAIREHREAAIANLHENNYHLDSRTVFIFGEINEQLSKNVQYAFDALEAVNSHAEIIVKVMSEGGTWFDGLAIYDRIKASKCPVKMIGTGLVGSTATAIFQAGGIRELTENCVFVLHDGTDGFEGEAKSFEAWGDASKKSRQLLYSIYAEASGKSVSFWQITCTKDCILWPKEILSYGLADKLVGEQDGE